MQVWCSWFVLDYETAFEDIVKLVYHYTCFPLFKKVYRFYAEGCILKEDYWAGNIWTKKVTVQRKPPVAEVELKNNSAKFTAVESWPT